MEKVIEEFKGTKGEWRVDKGTTYTGVPDVEFEVGTDNQIIASIHGSEYTHTAVCQKEAEANAKLIAAAPDMLEALQKIAANSNDHAMIRIAIKAIQKALK